MIEISVIVTAYNRKEFLKDALESLNNQTLEKDKFEVILITNFEYDPYEYIKEVSVKHIVMDGSLGEYTHRGIAESRGEIIAFLDDDDLFTIDKLAKLHYNFTPDAIYYKNAVAILNEKNINKNKPNKSKMETSPIKRNDLKYPHIYAYNKSSISVKKSFINKYNKFFPKLVAGDDWLLFFAFMDDGELGIYDPNALTLYRRHYSTSTRAVLVSDKNYNSYIEFLGKIIDSFSYMRIIMKDPDVKKIIDYQLSIFNARRSLLLQTKEGYLAKSDIENLFNAVLMKYNETLIIRLLFIRAFIFFNFPKLSPIFERLYALFSRKINSLQNKQP